MFEACSIPGLLGNIRPHLIKNYSTQHSGRVHIDCEVKEEKIYNFCQTSPEIAFCFLRPRKLQRTPSNSIPTSFVFSKSKGQIQYIQNPFNFSNDWLSEKIRKEKSACSRLLLIWTSFHLTAKRQAAGHLKWTGMQFQEAMWPTRDVHKTEKPKRRHPELVWRLFYVLILDLRLHFRVMKINTSNDAYRI